jgi:hypothetical protein
MTYVASFAAESEVLPNTFVITASSANPAMGSVFGGGSFAEGSVIQILALAADGYEFDQWSDGNKENPRTLTVTENATYTAIFQQLPPNTYYVNVISADPTMGTVSGGGKAAIGGLIRIEATANEGYKFAHWNDGNTNNPRYVEVAGPATYVAIFEKVAANSFTISVLSADNAMGSVIGGGVYEAGSEVQFAAIPLQGYEFAKWNDGSTENPRTITVTSDAQYIAIFRSLGTGWDIIEQESAPAQKIFRDGRIYILRNGELYTTTGQKVE